MKRYVAIDSGKFATKVAEYKAKEDEVLNFSLRTKVSEGDFRDDAIESKTLVVEIDGKTYKVGNGARGNDAELNTNKKTDLHRLCTLTALATIASSNEVDEMCVAICLPAKEWANVSKRCDFKEYMLPEGEIEISIKKNSASPVVKKKFKIVERYVFPESIGALFMDECLPYVSPTAVTGVIDLGNLNLNATLWQGTELVQDKSATADLGGAMLIQELSQELSSNITTCDELITATILKSDEENRHLPDDLNLTSEQIEKSKEVIKRVLRIHAEKVKRCCQARNWSLDVTRIVAIGGTSKDIEKELKETFGNIMVLENSEFCNAFGCLRMMCSRIPEINKIISLKKKKVSEKADKNAA